MVISLTIAGIYGFYVKQKAVNDLAKIDARKTSLMAFETLYAAMEKGWSREDLSNIISRLNQVEPSMKINAWRSQKVADIFGDIPDHKIKRENDPYVKSAMNGQEVLLTDYNGQIRYIYPITVKKQCISCHKNTKEGDVNGVIDIIFPASDLKISLSMMLNSFILFFVVFMVLTFGIIFFNLNRLVVKPIQHFINNMKDIISNNDISKRVLLSTKISEVKSIEEFFNRMLDSLQEYYDKLRELSDRDYLTKLYNRRKFEEFLEYEVHRSDRHKYSFCVVMIDLDNFKFINDTYGHAIGDLALKEVALIFSSQLRRSDIVARIGGDEFAVILPDTNGDKAFATVSKLKDILSGSVIELIEDRVHITASFGITEYPSQADSAEELMTCSDLAMYKAKKSGKNAVATVDTSDKSLSVEIFRKGEFIKKAIDEDRIVPFFQPIYDIVTNKIFAYEVLARIEDNGAFLSAGQFIEVAEELNLSQAIDQTIIKKGLRLRHEKAIDDCYFFFNISSKIFTDKPFMDDLMAVVDQTVFGDNGRIVFEILEREAIPNIKEFIDMIKLLKKKNILFALDDFGAGFSSFTYLKYFDVDFVKIDGEFIKNIAKNQQDEIFVRHIHGICHEFGKLTIAEYIEDEEILEAVKKIGINYAQGFHLGKPGHLE